MYYLVLWFRCIVNITLTKNFYPESLFDFVYAPSLLLNSFAVVYIAGSQSFSMMTLLFYNSNPVTFYNIFE